MDLGWARRISPALVALLSVTVATLGVGFAYKDACSGASWDGLQYRALCYNDIAPLYTIRHMDTDSLPYTDHGDTNPTLSDRRGFLEYPVLTGLLMWTAARLGTIRSSLAGEAETGIEFFYWNAALLSLCALGVTYVAWRMAPDPRRVAYWTAGSPLALYAFHNWDLLAIFFVILGLWSFGRGSYLWSGVWLAMGANAKLFPIVIPPLLWVWLVRTRAPARTTGESVVAYTARVFACPPAWKLAAGTVAGLLVANVPFLVFGSPELWLETFRFHARRTPNFETVWFVARWVGERTGTEWLQGVGTKEWLDTAGLLLFVGAYAGLVAWTAWRRPPWTAVTMAPVLLFLLLNKIFSVQYALWVLPFVVLVRLPAWSYALYAAADLWVYATLFPIFTHFDDGTFNDRFGWVAAAIVARAASLAVLLVLALRQREFHEGGLPRSEPSTAAAPA